MRHVLLAVLSLLVSMIASTARAQGGEPMAAPFLYSGDLAGGEAALLAQLQQQPQDDQARFGLAALRLMAAVQRHSQYLYRFGFTPGHGLAEMTPFGRLPIAVNPQPQEATYEDMRTFCKLVLDDLATVQTTLEPIKDAAVQLPLRLGLIRLDLDGDGQCSDSEQFYRLLLHLGGQDQPSDEQTTQAQQFVINFDYGDVHWLRGYCHLLSAMMQVALAHDSQQLFNHTAHLFLQRPKTPYPFLLQKEPQHQGQMGFDVTRIMDAVAFIHLLNLPVREPQRMTAALEHLEQVIACSRASWQAILAEQDNDAEWIPNPDQAGVLPNAQVTAEMVQAWHRFLDEAEALLGGKLLLPFWRPADGQGVNLRKVFTHPRGLDLVLWVQGPGAAPYLEQGPITQSTTWQQFMTAFGGQFIGFAIWFN